MWHKGARWCISEASLAAYDLRKRYFVALEAGHWNISYCRRGKYASIHINRDPASSRATDYSLHLGCFLRTVQHDFHFADIYCVLASTVAICGISPSLLTGYNVNVILDGGLFSIDCHLQCALPSSSKISRSFLVEGNSDPLGMAFFLWHHHKTSLWNPPGVWRSHSNCSQWTLLLYKSSSKSLIMRKSQV